MSNTRSNKMKLLQSASALILGASAMTAQAQTVSTSTSAVTLASTDAKIVADQSNTAATTATLGSETITSTNDAVSTSSVSLDSNSAKATAISNTAAESLKDGSAATTDTTSAIAVEQDNAASTTATIGTRTTDEENVTTLSGGTEVTLSADATTGSTLTVANNANLATATSNTATTSVSDTDFTSNSTSTTLATRQDNTGTALAGVAVSAKIIDGTDISLTSAATSGSDLSISGNTDAAAATGNSLSQSTTLTGTTLTLGTTSASANTAPSGETAGVADIDAAGAALMSSRQTNTYTDVTATNYGSAISLATGATNGSTLDVTSNTQGSTAIGSTAANAMALSGTTVGTGAAIVSGQTNDSHSDVTATTTGNASIVAASLGETGSAVSMTDNKLQSRATGGSVANTLGVSATTVTLQAPDATAAAVISNSALTSDTSLSGTVSGAYATLNDQLISGDVSATTNSAGLAGYRIQVSNSVENGSTITNDRNALTAQAQGAVATNSTAVNVGGSFTEGEAAAVKVANGAVVANIQELADSANVTATVNTVVGEVYTPAVYTVVSGNVEASSIDASSNKAQAYAEGATSTNSLNVTAQTLNVAAGDSAVPGSNLSSSTLTANTAFAVANRQDSGTGSIIAQVIPAGILTGVDGNTDGSSVTSTGNMQDAFATSNKSTNGLSLSATTLDGDAGVINAQNSAADVGSIVMDTGVEVGFSGSVTDSSVAVTGNMARGSAIGNVGNNTLSVAATTLSGDGTADQAVADSDNIATTADFSLGNSQVLDSGGSSNTLVAAQFGIDQSIDHTLSNSKLSVSNNVQFGEALGNSATNSVTLVATGAGSAGIDPTAALDNSQTGNSAAISSYSSMDVYANAASSASSIALNGNSNTALGVVNTGSNSMSITGLAVDGSSSSAVIDLGVNTTTADYALNSYQSAGGTLTSTAQSAVHNTDYTDETTSGLQNGSVTMSKNATTAEGSANRVANSLSVSATDNGATAAIGNEQYSSTGVTSTASFTSYKLTLATETEDTMAASGSTLAMDGNTTTALARGNSASNALNYTVGASYTGVPTNPTIEGTGYATAGALVLNAQTNEGSVAANAYSVSYAVDLSGSVGDGTGAALNSSANMANNAVTAVAYGNSATNSVTMSTFAYGIPSTAISNAQENAGAVTATATSVAFNMTMTGPVSGSALRNGGNSVSAQAIGNSSVSSIGGGL